MCTPYPKFVSTGVICIKKALKGTEIVFVLTVFVLMRFYCNELNRNTRLSVDVNNNTNI